MVRLALRPPAAICSSSSMSSAVPPPVPPSVKLGRTMMGKPISSAAARASSRCARCRCLRHSRPASSMAALNRSRSSARLMTSALAPIISTPYSLQHAAARPLRATTLSAGLAAEGGQQGVRPLLRDDLVDRLRRDRLDVGAVRHLGVGHDRGRVAVDQHDLVALLAQRLAGLGAGVVELAGLADDDRAGADDQNLVDVGSFWHRQRKVAARRVRGGRRGLHRLCSVAGPASRKPSARIRLRTLLIALTPTRWCWAAWS